MIDEVLNIVLKELNMNGNKRDLLERYVEILNKYQNQYAKEFSSQTEDYRDNIQKEKLNILTLNLTSYQFMNRCQI